MAPDKLKFQWLPQSGSSFIKLFPGRIEIGIVGFCGRRKTGELGEKPSEQRRDQQQTQPTYDVNTGNRTRATLVGGDCFHHCAILAPLVNIKQLGGVAHTPPPSLLTSTPHDFPVNAMVMTSLAKDHKA